MKEISGEEVFQLAKARGVKYWYMGNGFWLVSHPRSPVIWPLKGGYGLYCYLNCLLAYL